MPYRVDRQRGVMVHGLKQIGNMAGQWRAVWDKLAIPPSVSFVFPCRDVPPLIRSPPCGTAGFCSISSADLISNAGSQMRIVAVQWEITLREPDPRELALYLGYIGLALVLPVILFALPAGAAADRFSRRWLIMIAQVGLAACGVGLAWASWTEAPLLLIYLLLFGTGTFRALGWPASTAIVTGLVPAKTFSNAATWRSNAYQLASTLGPLAGGFLLAWWSPVIVFLIDAASSLILATCMLFVRPRPQTTGRRTEVVARRDARHSLPAPPADHSFHDDAGHGGRAVRRRGCAAADFCDGGFQRRCGRVGLDAGDARARLDRAWELSWRCGRRFSAAGGPFCSPS